MNICVLDGYTLNPGDLNWSGLEALGKLTIHDWTPLEQTLERCKDADVVFTNKAPISAEVINACPKLKFIGVLATGFNIVDVEAAKQKGIPVCNVPGYSTHSVAQLALSLILQFSFKASEHSDRVHRGDWVNSTDFSFTCGALSELAGKTPGIVGLGDIGQAVAKLGQAFGMRVLAHTRTSKDIESIHKVSLDMLLKESDVISLHCPLTEQTSGMMNTESLGKMKNSAILINTSRGPLLDEAAVAHVLNRGDIAGAGVDVLSCEPPKADNPMLSAKNCVITPHIAWATVEARQRLMATTVENLKAHLNGQTQNRVNL